MKKKNRLMKIALLGFCMLGLVVTGCSDYDSEQSDVANFTASQYMDEINRHTGGKVVVGANTGNAILEYLPAQTFAVKIVSGEENAYAFAEALRYVENVESSEVRESYGAYVVIVRTAGTKTVDLEEYGIMVDESKQKLQQ